MSQKKIDLKVGEPFSPHRLFFGAFLPNCLMRFTEISPHAKIIWARLSQFYGKSGRCNPSFKLISVETGISERKVYYEIKALVEAGFLKKTSPSVEQKGKRERCSYEFLFHQIFYKELSQIWGAPPAQCAGVPGAQCAGDSCTVCRGSPAQNAISLHYEENHKRESTGILHFVPKNGKGGDAENLNPEEAVRRSKELYEKHSRVESGVS